MIKRLLADEKVMSVSGTVLFHGLLLILLLLLTVDFRPVIEEFAEVTFSGGWLAPAREFEPVPVETPAEETPAVEETSPPLPEEIELPERRELDLAVKVMDICKSAGAEKFLIGTQPLRAESVPEQ